MEEINKLNALGKQGSGSSSNMSKELTKNFSTPRGSIPNREHLDIKDVADVHVGANNKLVLKNVREDANGRNFVEINGRRYYEYNGRGIPGKGEPEDSFYISRGSALFFGDRLGVMPYWDGISFRCSSESMDNSFFVEQRKSRYGLDAKGGYVYLQQLIRSEKFQKASDNSNLDNFGYLENV